MIGKKNRHQQQLDDARRERDEVRREGEDQKPMVRRLRKRVEQNHFAEDVLAVLIRRRNA